MKGKWGWGDTNEGLNPCCACHDPHRATKEYPCSLPSDHAESTREVWGDDDDENMDDYVGTGRIYEPPYKVGMVETEWAYATAAPDYNTLCLECHQYQQTSKEHGTVKAINWGPWGDKHGKGSANPGVLNDPYEDLDRGKYVLCCTDCHEPHGSRNESLLRTAVNGTPGIEVSWAGDTQDFCKACHFDPHTTSACTAAECHGHGTRNDEGPMF